MFTTNHNCQIYLKTHLTQAPPLADTLCLHLESQKGHKKIKRIQICFCKSFKNWFSFFYILFRFQDLYEKKHKIEWLTLCVLIRSQNFFRFCFTSPFHSIYSFYSFVSLSIHSNNQTLIIKLTVSKSKKLGKKPH